MKHKSYMCEEYSMRQFIEMSKTIMYLTYSISYPYDSYYLADPKDFFLHKKHLDGAEMNE